MKSADRGQVDEIDGLRGVAILTVLLSHVLGEGRAPAGLQGVVDAGWFGVDLFFVISGFLITGILVESRGGAGYFRTFYARRMLRIFPLYFAFLTALIVGEMLLRGVTWSATPLGREAGSPLWYYLFLTNLRQAITGFEVPPILRILWSLAIEEQFYLVFPLLVYLVSPRTLPRWIVGVAGIALFSRWAMLRLAPADHSLQYLVTVVRLDTIGVGVLAAILLRSSWWARHRRVVDWMPYFSLALFLLVGVTSHFDRSAVSLRLWGYSAVALAFGGILIWTLEREGMRATGWLRWNVLRSFGRLCFGIYVLHVATGELFRKCFRAVAPALGNTVVEYLLQIVACYVVAWLSWRLVEGPINRLKVRFPYSAPAELS